MSAASAIFEGRRNWPPVMASRGLWRRLLARRSARAGLLIASLLCAASIAGPWIWPVAADKTNFTNKLAAPNSAHPLGTDQYGRDQLARILAGGRRSLSAALIVLCGVLVISLIVGIAAGMIGGLVEAVTMRLIDVLLAMPAMVLALAVVGVLGAGYGNLLLALTVSSWAYYARLARGCVRLSAQRPDVTAARMAGISWLRVTTSHIVPGVLSQLMIVATLDLGWVIISIAGLSFLGLGVQPPDAEWGAMLSEARLHFTTAPWLLVAPAVAIFLSVISANLIGNALRDTADPARML